MGREGIVGGGEKGHTSTSSTSSSSSSSSSCSGAAAGQQHGVSAPSASPSSATSLNDSDTNKLPRRLTPPPPPPPPSRVLPLLLLGGGGYSPSVTARAWASATAAAAGKYVEEEVFPTEVPSSACTFEAHGPDFLMHPWAKGQPPSLSRKDENSEAYLARLKAHAAQVLAKVQGHRQRVAHTARLAAKARKQATSTLASTTAQKAQRAESVTDTEAAAAAAAAESAGERILIEETLVPSTLTPLPLPEFEPGKNDQNHKDAALRAIETEEKFPRVACLSLPTLEDSPGISSTSTLTAQTEACIHDQQTLKMPNINDISPLELKQCDNAQTQGQPRIRHGCGRIDNEEQKKEVA